MSETKTRMVVKTVSMTVDLAERVEAEAKKVNRSFSNFVATKLKEKLEEQAVETAH